jgi:hypothetical protein
MILEALQRANEEKSAFNFHAVFRVSSKVESDKNK